MGWPCEKERFSLFPKENGHRAPGPLGRGTPKPINFHWVWLLLLKMCHYYIRISNKNLQCTDIGSFLVGFPTQNQFVLHFPTQNDPFPSYINFWANRCFIIDVIHHCLHHFDASDFDRDLCSHLLPSQCCHHCCASDFDAHFCSGTDWRLRFFCDTCCLLESKTCTVCGLTFVV